MTAKPEVRPVVPFRRFLMDQPPPATRFVTGISTRNDGHSPWYLFAPKVIEIYCEDERCQREMLFEVHESNLGQIWKDRPKHTFIEYTCRHCEESKKVYALFFRVVNDEGLVEATKIGEVPFFAPPLPTKLFNLVGPDQELFLKGRRAENANLGIGAFSYYRRVVENQKNRLFNEIIRVAKRRDASAETIELLERAKGENQFKKAIDDMKGLIPKDLLIRGQNPLTLLYGPLSDGIHGRSDQECLELASSIRIVMTDLAERMDGVLKDQTELDQAVARLNRAMAEKVANNDPAAAEEVRP